MIILFTCLKIKRFTYTKCKGCKKGMLNFSKENMLDKYLILSLIFFFLKNGQSPLHKASSRGHVDVVIHLVANGAQVGSLDWVSIYLLVLKTVYFVRTLNIYIKF